MRFDWIACGEILWVSLSDRGRYAVSSSLLTIVTGLSKWQQLHVDFTGIDRLSAYPLFVIAKCADHARRTGREAHARCVSPIMGELLQISRINDQFSAIHHTTGGAGTSGQGNHEARPPTCGETTLHEFTLPPSLTYATETTPSRDRRIPPVDESLAEQVSVFVAVFDIEMRYQYANRRYAAAYGSEAEKLLGRALPDVIGDDLYARALPYIELARMGETVRFESQLPLEGRNTLSPVDVTLIPQTNDNEEVESILALFNDMTQQRHYEETLSLLANTDPLTSLHNRHSFMSRVHEEISRSKRYRAPLCMLVADADHFQSVKNYYGQDAGAETLITLADEISAQVRDTDVVARLDGEEFAVLLPETTMFEACRIAERIRRAIASSPTKHDSVSPSASISLGVSMWQSGVAEKDLLKHADRALERAKAAGRNQVFIAEEWTHKLSA